MLTVMSTSSWPFSVTRWWKAATDIVSTDHFFGAKTLMQSFMSFQLKFAIVIDYLTRHGALSE